MNFHLFTFLVVLDTEMLALHLFTHIAHVRVHNLHKYWYILNHAQTFRVPIENSIFSLVYIYQSRTYTNNLLSFSGVQTVHVTG